MRQIIPTQAITTTNKEKFPVQGDDCRKISTIVAMELYGCPVSEVARELNCSVDDIFSVTDSPDYMRIKNAMIDTIRKIDRNTLSGRILQEASNAFDRMTELAENAKKEDVKFSANKDLLDRALVNQVSMNNADELRITLIKRR